MLCKILRMVSYVIWMSTIQLVEGLNRGKTDLPQARRRSARFELQLFTGIPTYQSPWQILDLHQTSDWLYDHLRQFLKISRYIHTYIHTYIYTYISRQVYTHPVLFLRRTLTNTPDTVYCTFLCWIFCSAALIIELCSGM